MISVAPHEPHHERQGSIWEYVSPSRLALFLRCPLAFQLRYIDGIRTPTSPALFVGKAVHAGLEALYRHRMLGIALSADELACHVVRYWDQSACVEQVQFESTSQENRLRSQAVKLVKTYLAQIPDDEPRPLAVEATIEAPLIDPFTGEALGLPLLGVVDLILTGREGPRICDFKTAAKASPPHEIAHELQLTSYAWLFRQATGNIEAGLEIRSLIKTKSPRLAIHRYPARTEKHFRRLFAVLREYRDAIDAGRFNFRPGWGCNLCEFRETHCRQWRGE